VPGRLLHCRARARCPSSLLLGEGVSSQGAVHNGNAPPQLPRSFDGFEAGDKSLRQTSHQLSVRAVPLHRLSEPFKEARKRGTQGFHVLGFKAGTQVRYLDVPLHALKELLNPVGADVCGELVGETWTLV
jgi:hypothetical protein